MIKEKYIYSGLGFPVILKNVEVIKIRGFETPKINFDNLMYYTVKKLARLQTRLSGSHIYFIRKYFEFSLKDFVNLFYLPSIKELEEFENNKKKMNWIFEKNIRFFIIRKTEDGILFYEDYDNFEKEKPIGGEEIIFSEDMMYLK